MERWQLIEWRVHSAEPIEDASEPAFGLRAWKRESEWDQKKANSGNDDCCGGSFGENRQLSIGPAKKRRGDEEEIDRHIGQDEERHERDRDLPPKEKCANVRTTCGDPIAATVNN